MQSKANPQLIIIVLPGRDTQLYQEIKHIAGECFFTAVLKPSNEAQGVRPYSMSSGSEAQE